jgi:hypothetical protein
MTVRLDPRWFAHSPDLTDRPVAEDRSWLKAT